MKIEKGDAEPEAQPRFDSPICCPLANERQVESQAEESPRTRSPGGEHLTPRLSRLLVLTLWLSAATAIHGEKLPIKTYSTADGLPHNTVMRIVRDSRGFLWFCTLRGLSRFDGYAFNNYGVEQGLRGSVTDLLETHSRDYWIATLSGVYRFNPPDLSRRGPKQE